MEIEELFDKRLDIGFMRLPLLRIDPADIDFNYVNGMVDEFGSVIRYGNTTYL